MSEVTTGQLDALAMTIKELTVDYQAKDRISKEAYGLLEEKKFEFMKLLEEADKSSYECEHVGRLTKVDKLSITVPKTPDDKTALFKWLKDEYGADGFLTYATVNSQSLNALYRSKIEEGADAAMFRIPGAGEPSVRSILQFRKKS